MKIVGNLVANAKEAGTSFPASHLSCLLSCYLPTPLQLRQRDGLVRAKHTAWKTSMESGDALFTSQATVFIATIKDALLSPGEWEKRKTTKKPSKQTPTTFYCCKFFIRKSPICNPNNKWEIKKTLYFSHLISPRRSCSTQCIDINHASIWCVSAMARAYPAIPRNCRIWIIKPSYSRRPYSRPWRPIRINWLQNWKSIRIRSQKDFAIRRVWLTLIGE